MNAIDCSTNTLYNAGALALGVILISSLFKLLKKISKKAVSQ